MRVVFNVAVAKPEEIAAKASAIAKPIGATARRDGDENAGERQARCRPPGRFPVGGEISHDAEAEGDRQPGQQPPRRGFGDRPFATAVGRASRRIG